MANLIRVGQKWRGIVVKSRGMSCKTKPWGMLKQGLQGITLQRYLISLGADFLPGSFI